MNKEEILQKLTDINDKQAYEYAKKICAESAISDKYLDMIPEFSNMLDAKSSFVRTRFFIFICSQSRWANNNEIKDVFDKMKPLLNDSKPTVVRQCLNALKEVIVFRPEMNNIIKKAISKIDLSIYKDSMIKLIKEDIDELNNLLNSK